MRALHSSLLVLIALTSAVFMPACSDDPVVPDREDQRLLPTPTLEYIRPLANTGLTFGLLFDVARNDTDLMVATAESTLTALVTAGVPLRDAWVTGGRNYYAPTGNVFVGVRLARADTSMSVHGFSSGAAVPSFHEDDMRHYAFEPRQSDILPQEVLEFRRFEKPPGLVYFRTWYPEASSTYYDGFVLSQQWLSGPEFYLQSLIEAGVEVNNAWVSATDDPQDYWGQRGIVLEVAAPHPVLDASGFEEGAGNGRPYLNALYMWNYCFTHCPGDVELPRPENIWTVVAPDRRRIYWRSILSEEYDALFGSQVQAEPQLREMLRAGAPVERAWIPVMAAAGKYTYMAVECSDNRVWWWGYEYEPAGGVADANRWTYVRCYDLRDPPDEDNPQPEKPHYFEQGYEGYTYKRLTSDLYVVDGRR